ncbi:hypothetical protein RKE29_15715, partial [Streptomyces sp. B1866]|uniref:hypothetical protein n=1 Tax=Streptomyces sp. B1866 TaxID=3075431 RepID=UPI00288F9837
MPFSAARPRTGQRGPRPGTPKAAPARPPAAPEPPLSASATARALAVLAGERPALAPHARALRRLATALRTGDGLDQWQYTNLTAAFADPATYDDPPLRGARVRRAVEFAPAVTVFVPLAVTWGALAAATHAYQRMLDAARAGRGPGPDGRTFLELWQTGFAGQLPGPLTFGWTALWTLLAIGLVVGSTVAAAVSRRHREDGLAAAKEDTRRDLIPLLHDAQALLGEARHGSPGRHAADLAALSDGMRATLAETHDAQRQLVKAQRRTGELVESAGRLYGQLDTSATALQTATRGFEDAARSAAAQAARTEVRAEAVQRRLAEAADALVASAEKVTTGGGDLARALMDAADEGARHIGETYRLAVAAAAVSLTGTMEQVAREAGALIDRARREPPPAPPAASSAPPPAPPPTPARESAAPAAHRTPHGTP